MEVFPKTHPMKVSRHREAPMRALKIKSSFMLAGNAAGAGQRGIYTELYFSDKAHLIEAIAPCARVLTFI